MNRNSWSLKHTALGDQCGQILPLVAVLVVGLLGMVAITVDVGDIYYSFHQLQASTDAAALAGAQGLPSTTATTLAASYSSVTGGKNIYSQLQSVSMVSGYPLLECLTTLKNQGIACSSPANANAIQVKQQASVPMTFARLFGVKFVPITATATAAMRGASPAPYNVAIIVDTTKSMSDTDSDSQCSSTRLACASAGVQVLLQALSPCASSESTCGAATNGAVSNSVDRVSLFTFPNVTIGTASQDYDCTGSNPTIPVYSFPTAGATSYDPTGSSTATYQVLGFSSDYRTSDTASSLNTGSNLTVAVGGKSGCTGFQDPGGDGTYYAGVIYAAQSALLAEQAANPGSQNVIVLLSDGNATAAQAKMASTASNNGTYPSYVNECGQAIVAAQAATAEGTRVYAVAYGAEASGCASDTTGSYAGITPCRTMADIASAPQYFFSDYTATGGTGSCISSSQPTTSLSQIFTQIAGDFTVARLIPDNTT